MKVQKAKRQQLIAAVLIAGPSGAGKTLGALLMAYGMMKEKHPEATDEQLWEKIGLIDTEHERSLVYESMEKNGVRIGEFLFLSLEAPYTVSRYDQAVKLLKESGAEVIVIDSTSHAWEAEGGLLDLQQQKGGNFQAWREVNPTYDHFIKLVVGEKYRIHTISTSRQKQEYAMSTTETGKLKVEKLGLKNVQRDSMEYEFQIVFNVDMEHIARTSKDNSGLFEEHPSKLGPEHGKKLIQWLEKGIDVKGEEEKQRLEFIEMTKETALYSPETEALLQDLEKRAKMSVNQFDLRLAERAYGLINAKFLELESQKQPTA